MDPDALRVIIVLSPFLLLPLAGWLGGRGARRASWLALFPAALTAYFAYVFHFLSERGPTTAIVPWAPDLGLNLAFHFDGLGLLFAGLVTGIGTLVVFYAATYLDGHPLAGRFQLTLFAFMGSMLGVVLSDNVILLFVFWELTGFTSYFLIGFDHERKEARRAALQALLVTGMGGLALLAAGIFIWYAGGTPGLAALRAEGLSLVDQPHYTAIVLLVLLAAFTKSAQFPFHFWLPSAMEAPTPVSAYLHSATMVKAGIYLMARLTPLLGGSALWTGLIVTAGAVTMLGGAYRALIETDLKRILAYTTISALGVLTLLLGVGTEGAIAACLVYLVAHACYKGALFMAAGAVDHGAGTRDVTQLGGLRTRMPRTATVAMLAAASMAGIPLLFGFVAKEQFYESISHASLFGLSPLFLLGLAVVASALLGGGGLVAGVAPFLGGSERPEGAHEPPMPLWLAPMVLAVAGLILGVLPGILSEPLSLATTAVRATAPPVHLALWHGFTPILLASALTLALTLGIYAARNPIRERAWPRALRTERLYIFVLDTLDAASRIAAPALQSASLRSYVRVIIVTAVGLVATAFVLGAELPAVNRWTPIHPHEIAVVLLVVAAAFCALFAQSTIPAVLCLGTVGYGVALIYALYGAPDLAMTQFAVETLTVVIFVLVFYQMRDFGDLSSRGVRIRDGIIAGTAGIMIALLVLYIGVSGTTSRLAEYFSQAAPTLGHGRNVVNVILVDFREFDTFGEITVLVTVAIGVRALLRIGKERRS